MKALNATAPWFAAFDCTLLAQWQQPQWQQMFNQFLQQRGSVNAKGMPLSLVTQETLPVGEPYEAFIHRTGMIPTRDNAHDFFNALLWVHLPRAKARLNALQAAHIATHGVGSTRGALRDACTLLDESGLLVVAPASIKEVLRQRNWHSLLVQQRALWQHEVALLPLGHALLEKLRNPYKSITAQVLFLDVDQMHRCSIHAIFQEKNTEKPHEYCALMDELLLNSLNAATDISPALLLPLPVLGIPGWWHANEDAAFYNDARVFRPRTFS